MDEKSMDRFCTYKKTAPKCLETVFLDVFVFLLSDQLGNRACIPGYVDV